MTCPTAAVAPVHVALAKSATPEAASARTGSSAVLLLGSVANLRVAERRTALVRATERLMARRSELAATTSQGVRAARWELALQALGHGPGRWYFLAEWDCYGAGGQLLSHAAHEGLAHTLNKLVRGVGGFAAAPS